MTRLPCDKLNVEPVPEVSSCHLQSKVSLNVSCLLLGGLFVFLNYSSYAELELLLAGQCMYSYNLVI
jgi:hypothetical protein